jgi:fructokinase
MRRIGIDLGGTKIQTIALLDDGTVDFDLRIDTPKTYDGIVAAVAACAQQAGEGSIGIGAPGSADPKTGLWRNSNATVSNGQLLERDLQHAIGRPIRVENDANCFALAEAYDGAGQGHDVVAFFTIGTGLGGGLVVHGKLLRGANAEAAEFGHSSLPYLEPEDIPPLQCFCGHKGCAEMYVSGTGLRNDYERMAGRKLTGPEIIARARSGEGDAQAALTRLQNRFARIIGNMVSIIDPDIFVMGGGMSELPELVEQLPAIAMRHTFSGTALPKIVRAKHAAAGARGAARLW